MTEVDDARLVELGTALADAVEAALGPWAAAALARFEPGLEPASVDRAVAAAAAEVMPPLRTLLALDVDRQRQGPLAVVRRAVRPLTEVLRAAGVPPVPRDDQQRALFPGDEYDLVPARFSDLGPEVGEAGIAWGAAKAFVHMRRHAQPVDRSVSPAARPAQEQP